MKDFVAIDFETANGARSSVCSVGIVIVRDAKVVDSFYSLIKPVPNYYLPGNTQVNGLTADDTENAPDFKTVWREIEPKIAGLPLVAHFKTFDENCLRAAFAVYNMPYPEYEFFCTCEQARRKLPFLKNYKLDTVSAYCGFDLRNHHHALADAEACAAIAIKIL